MKLIRDPILFTCACAMALFACKQEERTGKTTTTGAEPPVRYMTATARISGARCDRDVTCNQVGASRRFETREVCAQEEGKKTQDELKAADCPNGVDEKKLKACVDMISRQDCSKLSTSLQSMDECKTAALCLPPMR